MAPPNRKSGLNKKSDSIPTSMTDETQETSRETVKPSYAAKRRSRLPFKTRQDSFMTILKKNARDLTIEVTSDDDLVLSFKTSKQDSGMLDATKNQLLLPRKKSSGGLRDYKVAMRAGVHRVEMDRLKSQAEHFTSAEYCDEMDSSSKVTSCSILSEFNESLSLSTCSVIPKERKIVGKAKTNDFGVAIASTSKAYVSIHSKEEVLPESTTMSSTVHHSSHEIASAPFTSDEDESLPLNSKQNSVVTTSSFSYWKPRMYTTIGKPCNLNVRHLFRLNSLW